MRFPKNGVPQNGWLIMENPTKTDRGNQSSQWRCPLSDPDPAPLYIDHAVLGSYGVFVKSPFFLCFVP